MMEKTVQHTTVGLVAVLVLPLQRSTAGRPQQLGRRVAGVYSSPFPPPWSLIQSGQTLEQVIQPHKPVMKALPLAHRTQSNHKHLPVHSNFLISCIGLYASILFWEIMCHLFSSSKTEFCVEMGVVVKRKISFYGRTCRYCRCVVSRFVRVMPNHFII